MNKEKHLAYSWRTKFTALNFTANYFHFGFLKSVRFGLVPVDFLSIQSLLIHKNQNVQN